jgi:hypothetical protein
VCNLEIEGMFHGLFEKARPTTISGGSNSGIAGCLEGYERWVRWRIITSFMIHQFPAHVPRISAGRRVKEMVLGGGPSFFNSTEGLLWNNLFT